MSVKSRRTSHASATDDVPQLVLLVTEPQTDINAGFVLVNWSAHDPPFDLEEVAKEADGLPPEQRDSFWKEKSMEAKLQVSNLLENFYVEDRGPLMGAMVAKILLKFGAAQATCRDEEEDDDDDDGDDDDDDDITSQLFQGQHEKDLLRRMEPPLLMCLFMTNTGVQRCCDARLRLAMMTGQAWQ